MLFVVVPILELFVIVQVAGSLGTLNTIGLLILDSAIGAWLVKREGFGVMRRMQAQLDAGNLPTKELADGAMILGAGALMLTPGFITDVVGLLLLLPPVRAVIRPAVMSRFAVRATVFTSGFGGRGSSRFGGTVYDVDDARERPRPPDTEPPELL